VIKTTQPEVSLSDVNRLGIKERIGVGRSEFVGSALLPEFTILCLAASRLNGTLVKPGEEFSFNKAVGEISAATGYQSAYVIKGNRTELGDGGGVCQDSTTVFRAALDAGLPITMRQSHSYRVSYYEQGTKVGIDATVYSPLPDLRFL
jgi:vancomycin resistance protein YoaR